MADNDFPATGDKLFRSDLQDWQHNAVIDHFDGDLSKWYSYVDGYKEAAEMLASRILELPLSDHWLFPLVYIFRHHIELALKTIILIGSEYAEEQAPDYKHHCLIDLWPHARRYICMFWSEEPKEQLDASESLLRELSDMDKLSYSFRYPFDKKENDSLPPTLTHVNVRHFAETAAKLSHFLSSCLMGMDVELDLKQEYLADMLGNIDY